MNFMAAVTISSNFGAQENKTCDGAECHNFIFLRGALKSLQMVTAAMKLKDAYSLEGKKAEILLCQQRSI